MVSSAELPVIKVLFIVLSIFLAVESIVEGLSSAGLTVEGLLSAGLTVKELLSAGLTVEELLSPGLTAVLFSPMILSVEKFPAPLRIILSSPTVMIISS